MLAALLLLHGDDVRMENIYFWSAVLIALTPVVVFGGVAVWVFRKYWKERAAQRGMRNAERGTEGGASVPRSDFRVPS